MNKFKKQILVLISYCVFPGLSNGQDLNLFQATDNPDSGVTEDRRPQRARDRKTTPSFTLVGISRFGDQYYASLLSREGESVRVKYENEGINNIDGFRGFRVASISARRISIRVPDSDPCVEDLDKGVKCNGDIALLSLSLATPMIRKKIEIPAEVEPENNGDFVTEEEFIPVVFDEDEPETIPGTNVLLRNPLTGELQKIPDLSPEERARRAANAERFRNFEVVRIADDEIPDGMRRVRTPFGDSLEPIE